MRPELITGPEAYAVRMNDPVARAKASPLAEGFEFAIARPAL
jgi:hypothetical protein